jgi:spermidine synthase
VGDAFAGLSVPWHLTTREFATQVRRVLRPGGVYVLNVIDYPPLGFARAELATLRDVFPHATVVAAPWDIDGLAGGNLILVASDRPVPARAIRRRMAANGDAEEVAGVRRRDALIGDAEVLTDDHAPVDQLLTWFD